MIPEDVLVDILLRLPVKSIIQYKSVCKSWRLLITDTSFTRLYYSRSYRNSEIKLLITSDYNRSPFGDKQKPQIFFSIDSEVCDYAENLSLLLPPFKINDAFIVGVFNGIFCLSDYRGMVSLWNPTIREHVKLPNMIPMCLHQLQCSSVIMGLGGYNQGREDIYKVVRIAFFYEQFHRNFSACEVTVYTLGMHSSWRIINNESPLRPFYIMSPGNVIHLNGAIHWVGALCEVPTVCNTGISFWDYPKIIPCFDLKNERFGEIPWRNENVPHRYHHMSLADLRGFLCIGLHDIHKVEIWIMKDYGVKSSWGKIYCVPNIDPIKAIVIQKKGDILMQRGEGTLLVYDPSREKEKLKLRFPASNIDVLKAYPYVPSIFSIESFQ
ncbi:hypothetical protein ACHQM5_006571 [Ranunculus cassubicifolius]